MVSKTKTVRVVYFANQDKGITYRYEATCEDNTPPVRINFTIEKDSLVIARGYQDNQSGLYSLEVIRQVSGFERSVSQSVVDSDLIEIVELLK